MRRSKSITVCANTVAHSLSGARSAGIDIERLLHKVGILPVELETPNKRLLLERVVMLNRYCHGAMNDELCGLLEKPMRLGTTRFMALSSVYAKTQREALERCADYLNLFENSFYYRVGSRGSQTELWLEPIPGHQIPEPYAVIFLLTSLHRYIGWLGNRRFPITQARMSFPAPTYHDEFQYVFYGAPVLFNQDRNCLSFDSSYLEHPVVQNEVTVESYIRRAPMDFYLPVAAGGKVSEAVRNSTQDLFARHHDIPELNEVAEALALSPQTLRRRLKSEGASFQVIKAQLRRDIAIQHLGGERCSIEAIAALTGYSEPSAFIRAFKSWTGFTPLQFRKGLKF